VKALAICLEVKTGSLQAEALDKLLDAYAAELFQDVYTPEYAFDARAREVRERAARLAAEARNAQRLSRVSKF